jgi:hypothetical protein
MIVTISAAGHNCCSLGIICWLLLLRLGIALKRRMHPIHISAPPAAVFVVKCSDTIMKLSTHVHNGIAVKIIAISLLDICFNTKTCK